MHANDIPGVMQVVDSLDLGGTETVALNLANELPAGRFRKFLCTTRRERGMSPLAAALHPDVGRLSLDRTSRFDVGAMLKFQSFVRRENIGLLHVHGSALFFSRMAALLRPVPGVRMIWHDHYGRSEFSDRPSTIYRLAVGGASGVIAVNQRLVEWAREELRMSSQRVWYIPNFVKPRVAAQGCPELPGKAGFRIVCLANLRPQKDHGTLLRAMSIVSKAYPAAHLLLLGGPVESEYAESLRREIAVAGIQDKVTLLGSVSGAAAVLRQCDIGILSSVSEGLPLSLLEYGWAGLPVIATSVGQCAEVLDHGRAGILCRPSAADELASALLFLLDSSVRRQEYGRRFQEFVRERFDPGTIIGHICKIYDLVLSGN